MIAEKFNYQIISSDCERNSLREIFKELNINFKTALTNERFQLYLKEIVFQYWRYGRAEIGLILEGTDTSVEDCNKFFNDGNNIIYYLGPINISPIELAKKIKENDTEFDWTKNLPMNELLELCEKYIKRAKEYQKQCKLYVIKFVDTSQDREQVLKQVLDEIEKQISEN